jgi:undecaprenyl diphosphate synthase
MTRTLHVGIIMDGNGRWANRRGLPRLAGHRAGVESLRRIVESAPSLGIRTLTVYAFSSDNWKRPPMEVDALMRLMGEYLRRETKRCIDQGVCIRLVGRRDRLPAALVPEIEAAERATESCETLELRLAVDYSSRDRILEAAVRLGGQAATREEFSRLLGPDVDLLIRTGGDQRLSDFLLWECAYAEFLFVETCWPDFQPADLKAAVEAFSARERRFGALPAALAV